MLMTRRRLLGWMRQQVHFGIRHVQHCPLCSARGFICELCQRPQPIYPYETRETEAVSSMFLSFAISSESSLHSESTVLLNPCSVTGAAASFTRRVAVSRGSRKAPRSVRVVRDASSPRLRCGDRRERARTLRV